MKYNCRHHAWWGIVLLFLLFLLISAVAAPGAENDQKPGDGEKPLVVAFTPQAFFNVDPRDAIGAVKVWINNADRKLGNNPETTVLYLKSQSEVENALAGNEVDILISIADEFINMRESFNLLPVLSTDYGRNFYDELLLLVRADSGVTSIEQLRGKSLRMEGGQKGTIPMKWLHSLLNSSGMPSPKEFFGSINEFPKANQIIMPVFFGQADSCIASRTSFETMSELNPQLGRKLKILEKSPGFVTGIISVRKDVKNRRRDALIDALRAMDGETKGKQVLTIFRINRLVPFRNEHLASVEKLFRELRGRVEPRRRRK
jgi:ABC-type phosphate/phosphonate transport system substrate-binding protein